MSKTKLQVKYEGEKINLSALAKSIKALEKQYILYTKAPENSLYVNKVSEGSLIFEIHEDVKQSLLIFAPLLQEYAFFLFYTFERFLDLNLKKQEDARHKKHSCFVNDLRNLINILSPNIDNSSGAMQFSIFGNNEIHNYFCNHEHSKKITDECNRAIKSLRNPKISHVAKEVELVFWKTGNSFLLDNKKTSTTGVVSSIDKNPKKIIFENEDMEKRVLGGNYNALNYKHIVNIEIFTDNSLSGEEISAYKILYIHDTIEDHFKLWK